MVIDYLLILVIAICAWSLVREGMWGAGLIFFECLFAGLVAMNFFEPVAGVIEKIAFLKSVADLIAMAALFAIMITALREIDIRMCPELVRFPNWLHRAGGLVFGVATGWLVAGFLLCAMQTVPLNPSLGLGYSIEQKCLFGTGVDRQWLAFVHRTSAKVFDRTPGPDVAPDAFVFDHDASFIDRYFYVRHSGGGLAGSTATGRPKAGGGADIKL